MWGNKVKLVKLTGSFQGSEDFGYMGGYGISQGKKKVSYEAGFALC